MRKLLFLSFSLLMLACNDGELVPTSTPIPKPTTPVVTPTPTPPIVVVQPTDHDCGNATWQTIDTDDPDDPPGFPDSYHCYWPCGIDNGDPANGWPADPNPPHEVIKRFDYDAPTPAYQFEPTIYLTCYSLVP